jgi:hypothetical protein
MLLYKNSAIRHIIKPLENKGYIIDLVGSLSNNNLGYSNNDIDILLYLPDNDRSLFDKFENDLKSIGYIYNFSDEKEGFGIFHNYRKNRKIGLDVWIDEVDEKTYNGLYDNRLKHNNIGRIK